VVVVVITEQSPSTEQGVLPPNIVIGPIETIDPCLAHIANGSSPKRVT
jgi:hypothetical protein